MGGGERISRERKRGRERRGRRNGKGLRREKEWPGQAR